MNRDIDGLSLHGVGLDTKQTKRNDAEMRDKIFGFLKTRARWINFAAVIASGGWLTICVVYVSRFIGWESLQTFLPHEIGAFTTGVFAPLVLLWVAVALRGRSADIAHTSADLRRGLQRLAFPGNLDDDRVRVLSENLRQHAEALSAASRQAATQAQNLREVLTEHTAKLEQASELAASRGDAGGRQVPIARARARDRDRDQPHP